MVIYIDPWKLTDGPKADLILITHDHQDHCSPEDVAKIQKEDTVIVTVKSAADNLSGLIKIVSPGDQFSIKGIQIHAIPAYNINKFRETGEPYHPWDAGYVGYLISMGGLSIYHAGDTDLISEMGNLSTDVALLPVSGTYVMTAEEALEAAKTIKPQVWVPMHIDDTEKNKVILYYLRENSPIPFEILPKES
jgi:L-ascorbate metabolism protein UlaG (beta-lactamase superfamily)